ncbi:MAG: hypothetical protein HWN65_01070 [Candidatus Helarchaeota archaeon]|nr:hypothetical protein [Candidatus Helarchaeota archaeon]
MEEFTLLDDTIIAMEKSLENKKFNWTNIFANRLVTDAVLKENSFYNLFGLLIKDSIELISLLDRVEETDKIIIKEILKFIKDFKKIVKENSNNKFKLLWAQYKRFYEDLLKIQSADEEKHYRVNIDFTNQGIEHLLLLCQKELKQSVVKKRLVILGIMNELERIFKNFGFEIKHLVLKTYITLYNRTIDYIIFDAIKNKEEQSEQTKKQLLERISPFLNNLSEYNEDPNKFVENSEKYLLELAREWRTLYLTYLDLVPRSIKVRKKEKDKLVIPDEAKEQLKDMVSKSIFEKREN